MTVGLTTWAELRIDRGNLLVVINGSDEDDRAVATLFDALGAHVPPSAVHVIATPRWRQWLRERGVEEKRTLIAPLELNYFLESPDVLRWTSPRHFVAIVGSAPHALYNDEVKDLFEQRVCLLLGAGWLLAHTLPGPYLYVLDAANVLRRVGRSSKAVEYAAVCRRLVDDLYEVWTENGSPSMTDNSQFGDVVDVLKAHLGADMLAFDERSRIPLRHADAAEPLARLLAQIRDCLTLTADRLAEGAEAIDLREGIAREVHHVTRLARRIVRAVRPPR